MQMNLRTEGLAEVVSRLAEASSQGRAARRNALKDTGKMVQKQLKKDIAAGGYGGWPVISSITLAKNHGRSPRPWGKTPITSGVIRSGEAVIIHTRPGNAIIEEGGTKVTKGFSELMQRFLASRGIFVRKGPRTVTIPKRPLFRPVFQRFRDDFAAFFSDRFFYHLGRAVRGFFMRGQGRQS